MYKKENSPCKYTEEKEKNVRDWFSQMSISLHETISGLETTDTQQLVTWGILKPSDTHLTTAIVTEKFLGKHTYFGEGWCRGGSESFYKIDEIVYQTDYEIKRKYIAFKAIHSLGDIRKKTLTEAAWMAYVALFGLCGHVYAVGKGIIIKEFLEEDPREIQMSHDSREKEKLKIIETLNYLGLKPLTETSAETIQHNGKIMLIDLGSGDISGPDVYSFVNLHI